jgi:hypothetical protein
MVRDADSDAITADFDVIVLGEVLIELSSAEPFGEGTPMRPADLGSVAVVLASGITCALSDSAADAVRAAAARCRRWTTGAYTSLAR